MTKHCFNFDFAIPLLSLIRRRAYIVSAYCLFSLAQQSNAAGLTVDPKLPPYQPGSLASDEIVCAGNHATDEVLYRWAKIFTRYHPAVTVHLRKDSKLTTDAFDTSIESDTVDLIPAAREPVPSEMDRMTAKLDGAPLVIAVATGSYATKSGTHALAFYVNADNPLSRISIAQIREIYAPSGKIVKWGDLGLEGEWANQSIRVFSVPISDPNGNPMGITNFLQHRILDGDTHFRRSIYQVDSNGPGLEHHMLTRIVKQVANDKYAIGFSGFGFRAHGAKTLELAETDTGPFYKGTHAEVANRTYPLTRTIYLVVNRRAGMPLRPAVREFLRFILSRDGQLAFTEGQEKYLPLTADAAQAERAKLN